MISSQSHRLKNLNRRKARTQRAPVALSSQQSTPLEAKGQDYSGFPRMKNKLSPVLSVESPATANNDIEQAIDLRLLKALDFLERNLGDPALCLRLVSRSIDLSPWHFSRLFKMHFGLGFRACLRQMRLRRAGMLLTGTLLSAKQISALVGYKHTSDFYHDFKRTFGSSPMNFRRACDQGMSEA